MEEQNSMKVCSSYGTAIINSSMNRTAGNIVQVVLGLQRPQPVAFRGYVCISHNFLKKQK